MRRLASVFLVILLAATAAAGLAQDKPLKNAVYTVTTKDVSTASTSRSPRSRA